jgi:hypothetical protein
MNFVSIICFQEAISEGGTIRTIIRFLSNEYFQERALAVSVLHELSTLEPLYEKMVQCTVQSSYWLVWPAVKLKI